MRAYEPDELTELAKLFARLLISRPDVKAFQRPNGDWYPMRARITRDDIATHITGETSMGHYLVSEAGTVKFFAFDIDLEEAKPDRNIWYPMPVQCGCTDESPCTWDDFESGNPRGEWESVDTWMTSCTERFLVFQMRTMAHILATTAENMFGYRTLVTYSGHKGLHVYVLLDEPTEASIAREMAVMVLDQTDRFELLRGKNFYKHRAKFGNPLDDMPQLSVEIFPKQDTVEDKEKKLGNLMRLPLGRHRKVPNGVEHYIPQFLDVRWRMTEFKERDPIEALTVTNQWAGVMTE